MKPILLILSCVIATLQSLSQDGNVPCFFDQLHVEHGVVAGEALIQAKVEAMRSSRSNHSVKTIPVVVHIIHEGGAENISHAQIESQITILNEDFGKLPGTNGDGNGVDMHIRFCLAQKDPDGHCTNGVVRLHSSLTNHRTHERALLKELSFWDNSSYLNVYVVESINGGVGGYASFPGGPADEDGIVVRNDLFGNIGTASNALGRTMTHEVGHWLGLYHTFNQGCGEDTCTDGDFVCDTPPVFEPNFGCPANANSCSNDDPDVNDQIENYMDYTNDACKNMFSEGQRERAQAALEEFRMNIWSLDNLIATGCDSTYVSPANCPSVADFVSLTPDICVGNSVQFIDRSLNNTISWEWEFEGGAPSSSTSPNPLIEYSSTGTYFVRLIVTDSNQSDTLTRQDYITVSNPGIGRQTPLAEDFDSGLYPPKNISIVNYDNGITWELDSSAAFSGDYSIKINNLINTNYGSVDELVLPYMSFKELDPDSIIRMSFKWAYAKSDPTYSDEMIVLLSTDCGQTFNQVFYRSQNALATGPVQTTPFIPDSTQWKSAFVYLEPYRDESNVLVKIVNVTDGGNNLYIDDIYIGDGNDPVIPAGIKSTHTLQEVSLYPNPVQDIVHFRVEHPERFFPCQITVFNGLGQPLIQMQLDHPVFHLTDLYSGAYIIKVTGKNNPQPHFQHIIKH